MRIAGLACEDWHQRAAHQWIDRAVTDLPGVGRNLRCHAQCGITVRALPEFRPTGGEPPLQMGCRYTAAGSGLRNDMFLHPASCATVGGYYDATDTDSVGFFLVCAIYLAKGAGRITLASADPSVHPRLDYNFLEERSDLERMREGVRLDEAFCCRYYKLVLPPCTPAGTRATARW